MAASAELPDGVYDNYLNSSNFCKNIAEEVYLILTSGSPYNDIMSATG